MDQNRWFCFNDSSVQAAPFSDIYRTFGATYSYGYMNNMNGKVNHTALGDIKGKGIEIGIPII
jgi:hypothetical protein